MSINPAERASFPHNPSDRSPGSDSYYLEPGPVPIPAPITEAGRGFISIQNRDELVGEMGEGGKRHKLLGIKERSHGAITDNMVTAVNYAVLYI